MTELNELLRKADPLADEPAEFVQERNRCRARVLAAASDSRVRGPVGLRVRVAIPAMAVLMVMAGSVAGIRLWPLFVGSVQAAVHFEVRLAENQPAAGLREAKVAGADRSIYLHGETVVGNGDIASAKVIPGSRAGEYWVAVEFTPGGGGERCGQPQGTISESRWRFCWMGRW